MRDSRERAAGAQTIIAPAARLRRAGCASRGPLNADVRSHMHWASRHHSGARTLLALTLLVASTSCSTFAMYDAYVVNESKENYVVFESNGAIASLEFIPDDKLSTFGLLGVPAIPVYASTKNVTTIALELELTLWDKSDFYFSVPCLITPNGELCPYIARLDARLKSSYWKPGDDGAAQWISSFHDGPIEVNLPLPQGARRIDHGNLFNYFGYTGIPPWNFAYVQLVLSYKCDAMCPNELSIAADDLVVVSGKVRTRGLYQFRKTRVKDYDAAVPVQDAGAQ